MKSGTNVLGMLDQEAYMDDGKLVPVTRPFTREHLVDLVDSASGAKDMMDTLIAVRDGDVTAMKLVRRVIEKYR